MRIAHIIITHKYPVQLARLVRRLQHPQSDIYVHVDKKVDIAPFKSLKPLQDVFFIEKRVKINWGGNSTLMAMVQSVQEITSMKRKYDFINLISGQDYPLKNAQKMYEFFQQHPGYNFISYDECRGSEWWQAAVARYQKYHFTDLSIKWKYALQSMINRIMPLRKFPANLHLHGGNKSAWWTISGECASYMVREILENRRLLKFLKYCWGTDEFAIATLIMNSEFRKTTINNNYRYIDWSEGNSHPKSLARADVPELAKSDMLFARKFDSEIDSEVLDWIDFNLLAEPQKV